MAPRSPQREDLELFGRGILSTKITGASISEQSSAIYRGAMNLVVLKGALDIETCQPPQFDARYVQDDHIFPKSRFGFNPKTLLSWLFQRN